jgi:hypothetical protein
MHQKNGPTTADVSIPLIGKCSVLTIASYDSFGREIVLGEKVLLSFALNWTLKST